MTVTVTNYFDFRWSQFWPVRSPSKAGCCVFVQSGLRNFQTLKDHGPHFCFRRDLAFIKSSSFNKASFGYTVGSGGQRLSWLLLCREGWSRGPGTAEGVGWDPLSIRRRALPSLSWTQGTHQPHSQSQALEATRAESSQSRAPERRVTGANVKGRDRQGGARFPGHCWAPRAAFNSVCPVFFLTGPFLSAVITTS